MTIRCTSRWSGGQRTGARKQHVVGTVPGVPGRNQRRRGKPDAPRERLVDVALADHGVLRVEVVENGIEPGCLDPRQRSGSRIEIAGDARQAGGFLGQRRQQRLPPARQAFELFAAVRKPRHQIADIVVAGFDLVDGVQDGGLQKHAVEVTKPIISRPVV
jgi:hypothetical protein